MSDQRTSRFHILKSEHELVSLAPWRLHLNEIIFGAETPSGKLFDVVLIGAILISVIAVMFESVSSIGNKFGTVLYLVEWSFTLLFSIEYLVRLMCVRHPTKYVFSFYGVVDLLSIIPTYLSLFVAGANMLLVIRILRILRIFRILKLFNYVQEAEQLAWAVRSGKRKILVFLYFVCTIVVVFGASMYLIEGPENGFTSIPKSIYWAIVTLTTVGYGDVAPHTVFGQFVASAIMITGYAIIAVPTGIYTAELSQVMQKRRDARGCTGCGKTSHELDAVHCRFCGEVLAE